MTLSQSLIALTIVVVTVLILWYIDKEMKMLRTDINVTYNMLCNLKAYNDQIRSTDPYVPMNTCDVHHENDEEVEELEPIMEEDTTTLNDKVSEVCVIQPNEFVVTPQKQEEKKVQKKGSKKSKAV